MPSRRYFEVRNHPEAPEGSLQEQAGSVAKPGMSLLPMRVLFLVDGALRDGIPKYGAWNWRTNPVTAREHFDKTMRHLAAWMEREDVDADSGCLHLAKAIADLCVLLDCTLEGNLIDDRPPA